MPDAYVTDAKVAAAHDAADFAWSERVRRAAGRMCRWFVQMGAEYDFVCPPPPTDP